MREILRTYSCLHCNEIPELQTIDDLLHLGVETDGGEKIALASSIAHVINIAGFTRRECKTQLGLLMFELCNYFKQDLYGIAAVSDLIETEEDFKAQFKAADAIVSLLRHAKYI